MLLSRLPNNTLQLLPYFLATPFISFTTGANLALATIASEQFNWSASDFSFLFILASFAGILMAAYLPKILKHQPRLVSVFVLSFLSLLSYLPLAAFPENYWAWIFVFFIRSFCCNALYFLIEASFLPLLQPKQRARGVTLYFMASVFGYMIAPLLYAEIGLNVVSILIAPLSLIAVMILLRNSIDVHNQLVESPKMKDFFKLLKTYPVLWMICIVGGMASESVDAFLGVMALDIGYSTKESLSVISWFFFGGLILQYPLSSWMDKCIKMRFTVRLFMFTAFWSAFISLIADSGYWPLSLSLAFWGGLCYTIGVASLALVGDKFTGQQRIIAVALQSALYHGGCLIGPVMIGFTLDKFGGAAVPLAFGILCMTLLIIRKLLPRKKENALDIKPIWGVSLPLLVQMKKDENNAEFKERSTDAS